MIKYNFESFTIFNGVLQLDGWLFSTDDYISSFEIRNAANSDAIHVDCVATSGDVASVFGDMARNCRFSTRQACSFLTSSVGHLELYVVENGVEVVISNFIDASLLGEAVHQTFGMFSKRLHDMADGTILEMGSRARSEISRRHMIPARHTYIGSDIVAGPNVDLVLDAHDLSSKVEKSSIDAVFSFSVFEHLWMPWKVAIEINKVLKIGGIGFVMTHQTWPVHDAPCDYWRFSDKSWSALFNEKTGFRLLDVQMSDPAYIVPKLASPDRLISDSPGGFLQSAVLFEKISETKLSWDVGLEDLDGDIYPV